MIAATPNAGELRARTDNLLLNPHWVVNTLHDIAEADDCPVKALLMISLKSIADTPPTQRRYHRAMDNIQTILLGKAYARAYTDIFREATA